MPYSCQLQFGTSGKNVVPAGGTSTCRGIGREISHTSTFTIVQTMMRSPLGKRSFGRSTIAEYFARSLGNAIAHTTFEAQRDALSTYAFCTETRWSVPNSLAHCQRRSLLEYASRCAESFNRKAWREQSLGFDGKRSVDFSVVLCDFLWLLCCAFWIFHRRRREKPQRAPRVC